MERSLALVVDRDPTARAMIREELEKHRFLTLSAEGVSDAIDTLGARPVELLIVDLEGGGTPTRSVLRHARQLPRPPLMIGVVSRDGARDEERAPEPELFDLLDKPLSASRLGFVVQRVEQQLVLIGELRRLRARLQVREGYQGLVGRSPALERVRAELERLAGTDLSVWFTGEAGSGKAHAARAVHAASARADRPFVMIDCSALSAFDWAAQWHRIDADGRGEARQNTGFSGGTLYLAGLTGLLPEFQRELLDGLEHWPRPDPEDPAEPCTAPRVLVGTDDDPALAEAQGRLTDGLRARLAEVRLDLPPLRARGADVVLLARHFVSTICEINQLPGITLAPEALFALERYAWPGNVRELRNAVEHAVILASEGVVRLEDLPDDVREGGVPGVGAPATHLATGPFRDAKRTVVDGFERGYLNDLLDRHSGNVTAASHHAGMLRSALQRLLRKHGLKSAQFRRRRGAAPLRNDSRETTIE